MSARWVWIALATITVVALVTSCGDDEACQPVPGPPYSVSGHVRDEAGRGLDRVHVIQGCDIAGGVDTDTGGYWVISDIATDSCTFTPQKEGCTFLPSTWTVSGSAANVDFTGVCGPPYRVSGYVWDGEGHGIPGVRVIKGCDQGGWTETDATGYWVIGGISSEVCEFTPAKANWVFIPASRIVGGSARGVNFAGTFEGP